MMSVPSSYRRRLGATLIFVALVGYTYLSDVLFLNDETTAAHIESRVLKIKTQSAPPLSSSSLDGHYYGLAITNAFNHNKDPQRDETVTPNFDYIKKWYESIQNHEDMSGVVLENMFDDEFISEYSNDQVTFVTMNATSHPSFTTVPDSLERSLNDQRFFAIEWYLNNTYGEDDNNKNETFDEDAAAPAKRKNEYILLSDGHDVEFLRNPFEYMQIMDSTISRYQLYVGEEHNPPSSSFAWCNKKWNQCFDGKNYPYSRILNAGMIGGHTSVIRALLRDMNIMFLSLDTRYNCNMAVMQRSIGKLFGDDVISGFPFHTKFRKDDLNHLAYIKHK